MIWVVFLGSLVVGFFLGVTYMYLIAKSAFVRVIEAHIKEYH